MAESATDPADALLVQRLRAGDAAAFEQIVDGWSSSMLHVARSFVSTHATAEVLVRVTANGSGDVSPLDATELTVELAKIDGEWLIARVTRVPGLRH